MARLSKKNRRNLEKVPEKASQVSEAVAALKQFEDAKFDESVELSMKLGIDPKNSNQIVRGAFSLPHGIGKEVTVIAFCEGEDASGALEAGALEAGGEELAQKVLDGWLGFEQLADDEEGRPGQAAPRTSQEGEARIRTGHSGP